MSFSISGLSGSGLDTTQIVSDLMAVERIPYKNLETKRSNLQTEQAVFRQLNTKLRALQTLAGDLQLSTAYNKNAATMSKSGVLTATTNDSAIKGTYNIEVLSLAQKQVTGRNGLEGTSSSLIGSTFTVNGESITIDSAGLGTTVNNNKEALQALVKVINSDSTKYGGKATLIDATGTGNFTLSMTANETGETGNVGFSFNGVKEVNPETLEENIININSGELQSGKNASFKIDGVQVSRSTNTINDVIQGVTFTLTSEDTTNLTIGRDTNAITASVENFVKSYNDLIDLINTNLAMPTNEDTINPLQGDSTLKQLKDDMYNLFTGMVRDNGNFVGFMEELGLSIDKGAKRGSDMTGKIAFDKAMFATALAEEPDKITTVFTDRISQIFTTASSVYTNTTRGILSMRITGYDNEIKYVDDRLELMDRSLQMKEARLKQQFNNMEIMLNSLNSTQSWLTSQFEALTKSKS